MYICETRHPPLIAYAIISHMTTYKLNVNQITKPIQLKWM